MQVKKGHRYGDWKKMTGEVTGVEIVKLTGAVTGTTYRLPVLRTGLSASEFIFNGKYFCNFHIS